MFDMARRSMILLCVAAGMALIAIEVRFLHRGVLAEYPQANIPIVFGGLATLAALLALVQHSTVRLLSAVFLSLGAPIGLIGVQNHTEGSLAPIAQVFTAQSANRKAEEEGEYEDESESDEGAPALAPLGLAGLGLIGALAAWPERSKPKNSAASASPERPDA